MRNYMSGTETAGKWGVSKRRIQKLCEENRMDEVLCFGRAWAPNGAENRVMAEEKATTGGQDSATDTIS